MTKRERATRTANRLIAAYMWNEDTSDSISPSATRSRIAALEAGTVGVSHNLRTLRDEIAAALLQAYRGRPPRRRGAR